MESSRKAYKQCTSLVAEVVPTHHRGLVNYSSFDISRGHILQLPAFAPLPHGTVYGTASLRRVPEDSSRLLLRAQEVRRVTGYGQKTRPINQSSQQSNESELIAIRG